MANMIGSAYFSLMFIVNTQESRLIALLEHNQIVVAAENFRSIKATGLVKLFLTLQRQMTH